MQKPWQNKVISEEFVKMKIIKPALERLRAWFYMPVQTGRGVRGIPDFVACVPVEITQEMVGKTVGMFVGIEAKAPSKKSNVSAHQQKQLDAIADAYGFVSVVYDAETMAYVETKLS